MDMVTALAILTAYLFSLAFGALIADYILPHIPVLVRYIDTLPSWEDEEPEPERSVCFSLSQILSKIFRTLQHFSFPTCITK